MPFFRSSQLSFKSFVSKKFKKTSVASQAQVVPSTITTTVSAAIDVEVKLEDTVNNAFHDPSVLDIRRSMVFGLNKFVLEVNKMAAVGSPAASPHLIESSPSPTIIVDAPSTSLPVTTASIVTHPTPVAPVPTSRIPALADLDLIKVLGAGATGQVYLVRNRRTNARRALKVVPHTHMVFSQMFGVRSEQAILRTLTLSARSEEATPYFLELEASFCDTKNFYFLMPLNPTDIESEIHRCKKLSETRSRFYFAEAYLALSHLHSLGIIHRDVKPSNLLISPTGHVILADFGLSRDFHLRPTLAERAFQPFWPYARDDIIGPETPRRSGRDEKLKFTLFSRCGTGLYMAPELLRGETYSFCVDFWALAVSLYIMLTGRPPFDSDSESFEGVKKDILDAELEFWDGDDVSDTAQELLCEMLEKCPEDRLRITEIEEHPFFSSLDWISMETHSVRAPWIPDSEEPSFVPREELKEFVPGTGFDDAGPYPDFEWSSVPEDEFHDVELVDPLPVETQAVENIEHKNAEHEGVEEDESTAVPLEPAIVNERKPNALKAFFKRVWPWSKSKKSEVTSPVIPAPAILSTSTLNLPPTPSCFSTLSSSSAPWVEYNKDRSGGTSSPSSPVCSPSIATPTPSPHCPSTLPSMSPSPSSNELFLAHHIINGTGLLFKIRVWFSGLFSRTPTTQLVGRVDLLA